MDVGRLVVGGGDEVGVSAVGTRWGMGFWMEGKGTGRYQEIYINHILPPSTHTTDYYALYMPQHALLHWQPGQVRPGQDIWPVQLTNRQPLRQRAVPTMRDDIMPLLRRSARVRMLCRKPVRSSDEQEQHGLGRQRHHPQQQEKQNHHEVTDCAIYRARSAHLNASRPPYSLRTDRLDACACVPTHMHTCLYPTISYSSINPY